MWSNGCVEIRGCSYFMFMSVHRLSEDDATLLLPQPLSAKEMMMELDRWSLAEVSVAVEPLWHDLEHTIRIKPVSRVKYSGTRNAIPNKSELASMSLFIVFSVSNSTMNATANRCSCRCQAQFSCYSCPRCFSSYLALAPLPWKLVLMTTL